jgi:hypothetical protein
MLCLMRIVALTKIAPQLSILLAVATLATRQAKA